MRGLPWCENACEWKAPHHLFYPPTLRRAEATTQTETRQQAQGTTIDHALLFIQVARIDRLAANAFDIPQEVNTPSLPIEGKVKLERYRVLRRRRIDARWFVHPDSSPNLVARHLLQILVVENEPLGVLHELVPL